MHTVSLPLTLALGLMAALALGAAADPKPRDDTLGAKSPANAVVLFDGKDLSGWVKSDGTTPAEWPVVDGIVTVGKGSIKTEKQFGDFRLHLEFNVPYMPDAKGQARGNSGVYLQGRYELQVLDSYGLQLKDDDCGAIYKQIVPAVNACKPPLQWQTYDVTFHAPRFEGDKVVKKARVTVVQNGLTIIHDKEISVTPGGIDGKDAKTGPLFLQDHNNAVQYRNVWIEPID
jgi:3-keto-disaccharide hydrolase